MSRISSESLAEEKLIYNELCNEINHHDIFSFKLGDESLNDILSKTKKFEKKFFHFQRYNFKIDDLSPELSFYNIELGNSKNKILKKEENNNLRNNNNDKLQKKIIDAFRDKNNLKISEILENIMEDVNIFDTLSEEEQNKSKINNKQNKENNNIKEQKEEKNNKKILTPIEMVEKIETEYNNSLVEKIKSKSDMDDLYPLDKYKKNNELKVSLLSEQEKILQFQTIKEMLLIKDPENTSEEKDIFTVFTIDKPNQEPGNFEPRYMYIGTNKGKIIKILINNKNNSNKDDEFVKILDENDEGINCIDIFENYMVTGHHEGSIIFWNNNKIFDRTRNIYQNKIYEIFCIKLIKVHPKKIEIIFSDFIGRVYYLKRAKGIIKNSETKELLLFYNKCPIYKISFCSIETNLKKSKKKYMIFSLTSSQGITLLKIRPKPDNKNNDQNKYVLKFISSPTKNIEGGIFDSTFGIGFPPMDKNSNEKNNSIRGSVSESIIIGNNNPGSLFLAISFSDIINLYELKIPRGNKLNIFGVGHYINDKPIIHISFLTNSYMALITNDFYLKIINTFDFDKYEYNKRNSPTKNSLLIFENIDLKKLIMMKQYNMYKYDEKDNNFSKNYNVYINTIVPLNKSIIILGRLSMCQYTLLQWDAVIETLDREKQYEKMLWLAMVVFNNNKNLLTIQSVNRNEEFLRNNKYQILSPVISKFLIQVVMKEIDRKNFEPMKMFIEFCIGSELYECLYESITPLSQKGYDCYLYQNLTRYILNDDCSEIKFNPDFLQKYFNYYVDMHEKNLLSEILFHINRHTLLEDKKILSEIEKDKLINPYIFIKIKNNEKGNIDYFQPIKYLYDLFHIDYTKEIKGKLFDTESDKIVKEEYHKMIVENNINYFNEDISVFHEFLAHKILWYCNKILNKEEFRTDITISNNNFKKIAKKIIFFLTIKEIMKEFLEFDSYSYFCIISRYFIENELFDLIKREIQNKKDLFEDVKDFINKYSEGKINSGILSEKYFFYDIQKAIEESKNIFIKYDFYSMVISISQNNKEFILDKYSIKETIKFFINFLPLLENNKYKDEFNCHKKWTQIEDINDIEKEIENNLNLMVNLFDHNEEIVTEDILEILEVKNISKFREIRMHLYESSHQYEEYFKLYKEELEENKTPNLDDSINISKVDRIKLFFSWISNILTITSSNEEDHKKFKKFLLSNFNYLSDLSLKDLSDLCDSWFKGDEEEIIYSLNNSQSQALQFKYINYYFATHECDPDTIKEEDTYYQYLLLKIELLVKAGHKEQILNILHCNVFLCNKTLAKKLLKDKVYDACIFIYYYINELNLGIKLSNEMINKILEEINIEINSNKYLSITIDHLLNNYKKYIDLAVGICQKNNVTDKNENKILNDFWLVIINSIYSFHLKFLPEFDLNQNNYKTTDYRKINKALDESFELILVRMTDKISLKLIVKVVCEHCQKAGFSKVKNLNSLMFIGFRLEENLCKLSKHLMDIETENKFNEFIYENNKGYTTVFDKCEYCGKAFESNCYADFQEKIIFYKCNHCFHPTCFKKEGYDINVCPICVKTIVDFCEIGKGKENPNIINNNNEIIEENNENENNDKEVEYSEKKAEEHKQFLLKKQKLLQLRRIRKKKKEIKILLDKEFIIK